MRPRAVQARPSVGWILLSDSLFFLWQKIVFISLDGYFGSMFHFKRNLGLIRHLLEFTELKVLERI